MSNNNYETFKVCPDDLSDRVEAAIEIGHCVLKTEYDHATAVALETLINWKFPQVYAYSCEVDDDAYIVILERE